MSLKLERDSVRNFFHEMLKLAPDYTYSACLTDQSLMLAKHYHSKLADDTPFPFLSVHNLFQQSSAIAQQFYGRFPKVLLIDFLHGHHGRDLADFLNLWINQLNSAFHQQKIKLSKEDLRRKIIDRIDIQIFCRRECPTLCPSAFSGVLMCHHFIEKKDYIELNVRYGHKLQSLGRPEYSLRIVTNPALQSNLAAPEDYTMPAPNLPNFTYTGWQYNANYVLPRIFKCQDDSLIAACLLFKVIGDSTVVVPYLFLSDESLTEIQQHQLDYLRIWQQANQALLASFNQDSLQPNPSLAQGLAIFNHGIPPSEIPYHTSITSLDPLLDELYACESTVQKDIHFNLYGKTRKPTPLPTSFHSPTHFIAQSDNPHNTASQLCYLLNAGFLEMHTERIAFGQPPHLAPTESAFYILATRLRQVLPALILINGRCCIMKQDLSDALNQFAAQFLEVTARLPQIQSLFQDLEEAGLSIADFASFPITNVNNIGASAATIDVAFRDFLQEKQNYTLYHSAINKITKYE